MKATGSIEVRLSDEVIEEIALRVAERLKPLLVNNGKDEDELLTVDEAAALLKRDRATIYQLVNNAKHGLGTFPYLKQGRRLRFSKHVLLTWTSENGSQGKG
jgi:excisionase family DNA binding protein